MPTEKADSSKDGDELIRRDFVISRSLREQLKKVSAEHEISMSKIVRSALTDFFGIEPAGEGDGLVMVFFALPAPHHRELTKLAQFEGNALGAFLRSFIARTLRDDQNDEKRRRR
jgi:hypothetical protein